MGVNYNSKIILDSLSLCLDATNVKSYPGTGTTWNDLSSSQNNCTMYGSVPFATDTAKCFDFATTTGTASSRASLGFSFNRPINTALGNYTFECWIKTSQSMSQHTLLSNAGSADGFRYGPGSNGVYILCGPTYTEGVIKWSSTYDVNKWHHVVTVFDRRGVITSNTPRVYLYLDGVLQTNYINLPSTQTSQTTALAGIVRNPCCQIWTGKVAAINVYSKTLSAAEVANNYIASRGKFGL